MEDDKYFLSKKKHAELYKLKKIINSACIVHLIDDA